MKRTHQTKILLLFCFLLGVATSESSEAQQAGDNFEGAIWYFKMTPKLKGFNVLRGQFRVSDHVVYQKEGRDSDEFSKRVGVNHPNGKRTKVEFTDLRAKTPKNDWRNEIKGEVKMRLDEYGKWSGLLTDGMGRNWDFNCTRVKE